MHDVKDTKINLKSYKTIVGKTRKSVGSSDSPSGALDHVIVEDVNTKSKFW